MKIMKSIAQRQNKIIQTTRWPGQTHLKQTIKKAERPSGKKYSTLISQQNKRKINPHSMS